MPTPVAPSSSLSRSGYLPAVARGNCATCGFQNLELDLRCHKCGRRLPSPNAHQAAQPASPLEVPEQARKPVAAATIVTAPRQALPEHVKNEIHSRVERFKARRRGETLPLPFAEPVLPDEENVVPFPTLEGEEQPKLTRPRAAREIAAPQSSGDSGPSAVDMSPASSSVQQTQASVTIAPEANEPRHATGNTGTRSAPIPIDLSLQVPLFIAPAESGRLEWQSFRIATLRRRLQGISHDLGCVLMGILLFAVPFYWIAGAPPLTLRLIVGFAGASLLLALLYGFLFLGMFGETPGMAARGLRVVSFNGQPATMQQRFLRVAGALVSSGSFLCGYFWAVVDEERLCWHDHISKTVLTDSAQ